jgi:ABC-type sugar transport system ATPase subunit
VAEPFLHMADIRKQFGTVQALKDVTLHAYAGEALALIGANGAGKSTLMNILGGVFPPDGGTIRLGGQPVQLTSPLAAEQQGIAFVHQEMAMLPSMSVADNLFISRFPTRMGSIDRKSVLDACKTVLARLGCTFDPRTLVGSLSPGDQQMVEIARAIMTDPKVIIFDEPTSSLTDREKQRLFGIIRGLKAAGTVIIYISHFLDEVFDLCERATVLRNGETVGGGAIHDLTYERVVELMIGTKQISSHFTHHRVPPGEVVLQAEGLNRRGVLRQISFTLRQHEVVGLWGLLGSGRTELVRTLVGLDALDSGSLHLRLEDTLRTVSPHEAKRWIGMLTENRREEGLLLPVPVRNNMSLANLPNLIGRLWPFIDTNRETRISSEYVERLKIKIASLGQPVGTLSGGNQQKVIVGRWLQKAPLIYLMDEPTRGLDVGAKAEIRTIIGELADQGAALLVISSDIDEIMSLSDRYLVLNRGRIVADLPGDTTKNVLMAAAAGANTPVKESA